MGWLGPVINVVAVFLLWDQGGFWLISAICAGVVGFWSWGVMHNYAVEEAKRRSDYTGEFYDLTPEEAAAVPDWLAKVNFAAFAVGVVLLIVGFII